MAVQTFMSSPLSHEVVTQVRDNLAHVQKDPTSKDSAKLFVDVVNDLTEEALNYYFFHPMDIIKAGTLTRKFVSMGVAGSLKMVNSMGKKAVSSLNAEQMLELCDFVEGLIHEQEA